MRPVERINVVWDCIMDHRGLRFTTEELLKEIWIDHPEAHFDNALLAEMLSRMHVVRCLNPEICGKVENFPSKLRWEICPDSRIRQSIGWRMEERPVIEIERGWLLHHPGMQNRKRSKGDPIEDTAILMEDVMGGTD